MVLDAVLPTTAGVLCIESQEELTLVLARASGAIPQAATCRLAAAVNVYTERAQRLRAKPSASTAPALYVFRFSSVLTVQCKRKHTLVKRSVHIVYIPLREMLFRRRSCAKRPWTLIRTRRSEYAHNRGRSPLGTSHLAASPSKRCAGVDGGRREGGGGREAEREGQGVSQ